MSENFQETELNENQIYLQGIPSKEPFPQFQESKNKKKTELYPSELEIKKNGTIDQSEHGSQKHFKIDMSDTLSEFPLNKLNEDKTFQELIENVKAYDINPHVALFLIYFYKLKNEKQILDYLSTDRFDKYKHPFLQNGPDKNCLICEKPISAHHGLTENDLCRALAVYNSVSKLNSKDLKNIDLKELELVTCQICYNYLPKKLIFSYMGTDHDVCLDCLSGYLENEISSNKILNMHCPHCTEKFEEEFVKSHISEEFSKKYQRFLQNIKILADPLLRFCPKCPGIVKLAAENDEKATCPECNIEICTKCNQPSHNKTSCQSALDGELKNWSNKKEVQRCPKCKILVEKTEGCNHMTCFVCHFEFCWLCRGAYTSIHFFPLNPLGCPGLQSVKAKIHRWNCLKIFMIRFACLILCLILLPFAALLYLPVLFFIMILESRFYRRTIRNNCCLKVTFICLLVIICIVLEPVFLAIEVICVIPVSLFLLYEYIRERRRRNQRVEEHLQGRNIQERNNNNLINLPHP